MLWFFVILALSTFGLHLQAMEQSIEDDTIRCSLSSDMSDVVLTKSEALAKTDWNTLPREIKLHILSFIPAKADKIKDFFDYALVNNDFASVIHACPFSEIKNYKFQGKEKISINDIFFNATKKGNAKVVETLLRRGIAVDEKVKSNFGKTALIRAAKNGLMETVQLLLDEGTNGLMLKIMMVRQL